MSKKAGANEGDAMLKVAEAFVGMGGLYMEEEPLETVTVKVDGVTIFRGDPNDPHAPDILVRRL